MIVRTLSDQAEAASAVVDLIEDLLANNGDAALGLAAGATMIPVYDELARRCAPGRLTLAEASAYLLDEYVGLARGDGNTYLEMIHRLLVRRSDLRPGAVHAPDGAADDLDAEAQRFERAVLDAGIDVQLLGIGGNGHLAFNEPGSAFSSRTRVVTLAPETVAANARFFATEEAVPTRALTQGLGTICHAKRLVLLAFGEAKAEAVRAAVEGPVTTAVPASVLQRHGDVVVLVDQEAGALLG